MVTVGNFRSEAIMIKRISASENEPNFPNAQQLQKRPYMSLGL